MNLKDVKFAIKSDPTSQEMTPTRKVVGRAMMKFSDINDLLKIFRDELAMMGLVVDVVRHYSGDDTERNTWGS